ncbi:MAG: shikimate dehydrogenase, partial [Eubacterium sp.]|nr:shikimate dehydrogenase [Eubacterium sp.]
YNTDCHGFLRAMKMADIDLSGDVLLCGSGGVARMFAFEAVLAGCNLTIAVRDDDIPAANILANEIKEKLNKEAKVLNLKDVSESYNLIINGTPVGMHPNTDACVLPKEIIQKANAVFEAIYNPEETLFIKYAKEAGLKYSNGLSMLVWQAAIAEEIWNNVEFTEEDIQKVIETTKKELEK